MIKRSKLSRKSFLIVSGAVLLLIVLALGLVSYLNPNSVIGYRKLFIDSRTHTYNSGTDFEYSHYKFNISSEEQKNDVDRSDCSDLIVGGVFNPNAEELASINQNWWPKEACEAQNVENENKAASQKYIVIKITAHNTSSGIRVIPSNWLRVLGENGKQLFESTEALVVTPGTTVNQELRQLVSSDDQAASVTVKLPNSAPQVVNL